MKIKTLGLLLLALMLCSCASTGAKKAPMLQLSNETMLAANNNFEKLYELWLEPFFKGKTYLHTGNYINWDGYGNNKAFIDGFSRFCEVTGNTVQSNAKTVNQNEIQAQCLDSEGKLLSSVNAKYWHFSYESPETLALIEKKKEAKSERANLYAKKIKLNGPTGWIYFDDVKYRLLRIGTLNTSHPMVLEEVEKGLSKFTYLEDYKEIRKTKNKKGYLGIKAILHDGSTIDSNIKFKELGKKGSAVHFGARQHRFVVVDNDTNEPYTLSSWSLPEKMILDSPDKWKEIKNTKLKSNLLPLISKKYREDITLEVGKLLNNSNNEGWSSLIPHKEINERLVNSMISSLRSDSRNGCAEGQDLSMGVMNLVEYAKCTTAKHELSLINKGYSISSSNTPLAYFYLLKKVRSDYVG
ncbi:MULTISPECIES: hypothetical protein [unclassified Pseudoalteromonas]|uniref:hypothetical protein n=1 Tax=unclassified Pseudoalteromonas TaxID=194690 RepID=UPI0005AB40F4|nr:MULTISPECIES: hypothetical protein [unclassified Pseudoalteromonas]